MSGLDGYFVDRDKFEPQECGPLTLCFPCCACKHQYNSATDEPCCFCDHNAMSLPEVEK